MDPHVDPFFAKANDTPPRQARAVRASEKDLRNPARRTEWQKKNSSTSLGGSCMLFRVTLRGDVEY